MPDQPAGDPSADQSLQQRYAPSAICFGCGPANPDGLHIASRPGTGDEVVAEWTPSAPHQAFAGVLSGGIIGTLMDCHANWTAAIHLMRERDEAGPPGCVTAEYTIRLRRPTPTDRPVRLRAWVVESAGDRVTVDAEMTSNDTVTATARGVFVAVGPDHPAFERW
jgi:acyl-coenzyme A thioesterase PaaI-like protein